MHHCPPHVVTTVVSVIRCGSKFQPKIPYTFLISMKTSRIKFSNPFHRGATAVSTTLPRWQLRLPIPCIIRFKLWYRPWLIGLVCLGRRPRNRSVFFFASFRNAEHEPCCKSDAAAHDHPNDYTRNSSFGQLMIRHNGRGRWWLYG